MSDEQVIKYVSKENLKTVYDALSSKVGQISVNNVHPDADGNIRISRVDYANQAGTATDLESSTYVEQTAAFSLRTSGGTDNIFTGIGNLTHIYGNALYLPSESNQIVIENVPDIFSYLDINPDTFYSQFSQWEQKPAQNEDGNYHFTFSFNRNNWVLTSRDEPTFEIIVSNYVTYGLNYSTKQGSLDDEAINFQFIAGIAAHYKPVTIKQFLSTGFNLCNQTDDQAIAQVVANERVVLRIFDKNNDEITNTDSSVLDFHFVTNLTDELTDDNKIEVTKSSEDSYYFEPYQIYLNELKYTFVPPTNGYIITKTNLTNRNYMINLIWSGKKIDAPYEEYTQDKIIFESEPTLYRVNNNYDILTIMPGKIAKGTSGTELSYYGQIERKIGSISCSLLLLDSFLHNVNFIRDGSNLYIDLTSLSWEIINNIPESIVTTQNEKVKKVLQNLFESQETVETIYFNREVKLEDATKGYEYGVNDFGLEQFDTVDNIPAEGRFIYEANLIDKLRRSVVTYAPQPDVSEDERGEARQNLNLLNVNCYVGARKVQVTVEKLEDEKVITSFASEYSDGENTTLRIKLPSLGTWRFTAIIDGVKTSEIIDVTYYGNYEVRLSGKRFGFRRNKSNTDPSNRITYLYDAENYTPISFDDEGAINYGDWEQFITEVSAPVIITSGAIQELNREDQSQLADGGTRPPDGNLMTGFRKYIYVSRISTSRYEEVVFCDEKIDDTYQAYAHTNKDGVIQDTFYWGMFDGTYSAATPDENTFLRSVPSVGVNPATVASSLKQIEERALKTGDYYYFGYKSGWDFICDLITLITKNDDAQSVFGPGSIVAPSDGSYDQLGGFRKSNSTTYSPVRIFWIWNFYGGAYGQPLAGFFRKNITTKTAAGNVHYYTKMAPGSEGYIPSSYTATDSTDLTNLKYYYFQNGLAAPTKIGFISSEYVGAEGFVPLAQAGTTAGVGISDALTALASTSKSTWGMGFGCISTASATVQQNGPRAMTTIGPTSTSTRPRLTYLEGGIVSVPSSGGTP